MRRTFLMALFLAAAAGSAASAQVETRGKTQFGIAGFGSIMDNSSGFASAQVSITKFMTKNLEIGTDVTTYITMTGGGDFGGESSTSTTGDVFGRLRYNFVGQSMMVPYVSFGAGTSLSTDSYGGTQPLELQAGAGFKRFLNEKVSFNGEVNYTSIQVQSTSTSSVNFLVGLSIYTGR
jgi:hypothetical protein